MISDSTANGENLEDLDELLTKKKIELINIFIEAFTPSERREMLWKVQGLALNFTEKFSEEDDEYPKCLLIEELAVYLAFGVFGRYGGKLLELCEKNSDLMRDLVVLTRKLKEHTSDE